MGENNLTQQDKRENRRKRRQRSQLIAYLILIGTIALLAVLIVLGVFFITQMSKEKKEDKQSEQQEIIENILDEETLETPEPEPSEEPVEELTPKQKLDMIANATIEVMSLEDKVAGLFLVTPESITGVNAAVKAGDGTKKALSDYAVGGLIYSSKNVKDAQQFAELVDNTKLYSSYPLFVAMEEEGGEIGCLADAGLAMKFDSASLIGQSGNTENAYQVGTSLGQYLAEFGINLDLAPVGDLSDVADSFLKDRSYGSDPTVVSEYVSSMMKGLSEQGVTACLKHFPGMGSTPQDPAKGLSSTNRTKQEFYEKDFPVFQAAIENGVDMIMVGHMSAPSLAEDQLPASLSDAIVTGILRGELGYDGVVITEPMTYKAISDYYSAADAAVMALRAGCDMILMPENFKEAYNGVIEAVHAGTVSEERINDALRRIYRIKYADKLE